MDKDMGNLSSCFRMCSQRLEFKCLNWTSFQILYVGSECPSYLLFYLFELQRVTWFYFDATCLIFCISHFPLHSQGRKDFDLSLSVRYASLPNNAKLEMVKSSSSRTEQEVVIALQVCTTSSFQRSSHWYLSLSHNFLLYAIFLIWIRYCNSP